MRIITTTDRWGAPTADRPVLLLREDRWDDYGYKTTFDAELWTSKGTVVLGKVKIMQKGMSESKHPLRLPHDIDQLGDDYGSLGQDLAYYEVLIEALGLEAARSTLKRIGDIPSESGRDSIFQDEGAFTTSLLREGGARRALVDASQLFSQGRVDDEALAFAFETSIGEGSRFTSSFLFGDSSVIPSRINAIIGYNGAGKTGLLAALALAARKDITERRRDDSSRLLPDDIAFGRVLAVSYSAFDTFVRPEESAETDGGQHFAGSSAGPSHAATDPQPGRSSSNEQRDYVYCGLRRIDDPDRLKSMSEVADELADALTSLRTDQRWDMLERALAPLLREPSFQLTSTSIDFRDETDRWRQSFDQLSTGHKISLNIIVQMVAKLRNSSLVLIDEPESHLHPPLLAALMRGIGFALDETQSYAVIATHSPVVLQEVPARYVQMLRRSGLISRIEQPESETFGENVGTLTRSAFHLDNSESDYQRVIKDLALAYEFDKLEQIFPEGLSSQALALYVQYQSEIEAGD